MPIIYRHVVPNIPSLTAGNGMPCYDPQSGKPVYQAVPQFRMRFGGSLDLTALANDPDITEGEPVTGPVVVPASYINAHITAESSRPQINKPYGEQQLEPSAIGDIAVVDAVTARN